MWICTASFKNESLTIIEHAIAATKQLADENARQNLEQVLKLVRSSCPSVNVSGHTTVTYTEKERVVHFADLRAACRRGYYRQKQQAGSKWPHRMLSIPHAHVTYEDGSSASCRAPAATPSKRIKRGDFPEMDDAAYRQMMTERRQEQERYSCEIRGGTSSLAFSWLPRASRS